MWSWVLTAVGLTCFYLAGRKIWWSWYVGLAGQCLWFLYAISTRQWGFLMGVVLYSVVYARNAYSWTKSHRSEVTDGVRSARSDGRR